MSTKPRSLALVGLATLLVLAGCGDDGTADLDPVGAAAASAAETVTITGVDYGFEGVPDQVVAGAALALANASDVEVHEIVAIRIEDDSDLTVAELVELPDDELDAHLVPGPPATVIVALPEEEGEAVVGDGTLTDPGRYALVCFIPSGADPDELLAAFESEQDGPPQIDGGPPHAFLGMYAELTVVDD